MSDNKIVTLDGEPMKHEMEIKNLLEENIKNCNEYDRAFIYMGSKEGNVQDSMTWVGMKPIEAIGVISVIQHKMSEGI